MHRHALAGLLPVAWLAAVLVLASSHGVAASTGSPQGAAVAAPSTATQKRPVSPGASGPSIVDFADPDDDPLSLGMLPTGYISSAAVSQGPVGIGPGPTAWSVLWLDELSFEVYWVHTGSGFWERFIVQVPPKLSKTTTSPLLAFFHKFGASHNDVWQNTTFPDEAIARNWFLLSPLGASKKHYSSLESQTNTEFAFDWLLHHFGEYIDLERVYGVGFSMGGNSVLNFAARHLDPSLPMIAAAVNHTGGVDLKDTYVQDPNVQWILDFWFGGPPAAVPFQYERCSMLAKDPVTKLVDPATDLTGNLLHVPVMTSFALNDPLVYVVNQAKAFHEHFTTTLGGPGILRSWTGNTHAWSTLPEGYACNWLALKSLTMPSSGETLADRDARYFHFDVVQEVRERWTPFAWSVDAGSNAVTLTDTVNLRRARLHAQAAGLDTGRSLSVQLSAADGAGDTLRLTGYARPPAIVLRDGLPTAGWSWNALTRELELVETAAGAHAWSVQP